MNIFKRLKEQNMVLFLERLGHLPKKQNGHSFWYLSPFRDERTPSFKISTGKFGLDLYWDYGTGDHGNMVDFCCKYYNMTPKELYHHITTGGASFFFDQQNLTKDLACQKKNKETCASLIVKSIKSIEHPSLVRYLRTRAILPELYNKFCKEIHYQVADRKYFAIGFPNNMGGWELRNAYFKGAASPKSYSKIGCGAGSICVFEGFMDFLSYLTIIKLYPVFFIELPLNCDFLILNSLAVWDRCQPVFDSYSQIDLYLDRDEQGKLKTEQALGIGSKFMDRSNLFSGAKDLNDLLVQKQRL